jgi:hypothetical protein
MLTATFLKFLFIFEKSRREEHSYTKVIYFISSGYVVQLTPNKNKIIVSITLGQLQ